MLSPSCEIEFDCHLDRHEWDRQLRELTASFTCWPELFDAADPVAEPVVHSGDAEGARKLLALTRRLSTLALWHETKAEMLHAAAIRLSRSLERLPTGPIDVTAERQLVS